MRRIAILFLLLFLCVSLYSRYEIVDENIIDEIAQRNAAALWGEVAMGNKTPYYYKDNELVLYRYNFYQGAEFPDEPDITGNSGYCTMLVSARDDMPVILEHSQTLSHEYLLSDKLSRMAEEAVGKGYTQEKVYYLTTANVWYCVQNGDEKAYIRVLPPAKVLDEDHFYEFAESFDFFCDQGDFSEEWSAYRSGERVLTRDQVLLENHELMPFYSWHYGCGPTAAAMLLAWFDYNSINTYWNYSNLVDWHYMEEDDIDDTPDYHNPNTIYELADAMDTNSSGSTYCDNMVPGTVSVANDINDYDFTGTYYEDHGSTWYFNNIRDWVNDGLPIMIWINENHFVTAMGYNESSNEIAIHDPNVGTIDWINKSIIDGSFGIWADGGYGNAFNLQTPHGDLRRYPWNAGEDGEVFYGNDICEISWQTDMGNAYDGNVTIILNKDSKYTDLVLIDENLPNSGYYWWQVPGNIDSDSCRVWIELYDNDGTLIGADGSFGDFSIHPGGSFHELTDDNKVITQTDPDFYWFDHAENNWGVVAVRAHEISDNWGIALFDDAEFSNVIAGSQEESGTVNLIAIDGNHAPSVERAVRVAAINGEITEYDADIEFEGGADETLTLGTNPLEYWQGGDVAEIWDAYLTPGVYTITADVTTGNLNLDLGIFSSTDNDYYKSMDNMIVTSTNHGPGQDESVTFTVEQSDYYGVCVWAYSEEGGNYRIIIGYPGEWTGDGSTASWHNPDNWGNGIVPDGITDVHIPANCSQYPEITSPASCHDLVISEGAEILISEYLGIEGNAEIDGEFNILNNSQYVRFLENVHWLEHANAQDIQTGTDIWFYHNCIIDDGAEINLDSSAFTFCGSSDAGFTNNTDDFVINYMIITKSGNASVTLTEDSNQEIEIIHDIVIYDFSELIVRTEAPVIIGNDLSIENGNIIFEAGLLQFTGSSGHLGNSSNSEFCEILISEGANVYLEDPTAYKIRNMCIDGGLYAYNATIELKSGWSSETGTFYSYGSTVIFDGSGNQYINETDFNNVIIDKDYGGELIVSSNDEFCCESLEFNSGTVHVDGGSFTALDLADVRVMGNYILDSGTIDLYQGTTSSEYVDLDANLWIYGGTFNIHGGYPYPSEWAYTRSIIVYMDAGVLDFCDNGILLQETDHALAETITGYSLLRTSGDFKVDRADFCPTGGTIELYGEGTAYLHNNSESPLNDVRINKSNDEREENQRDRFNRVIIDQDTYVDGELRVIDGFIQMDEDILEIGGNLHFYGGLNMEHEADLISVAGDVFWYNSSGATVTDGEFQIGGDWIFFTGTNIQLGDQNLVSFSGNSNSYLHCYSSYSSFGNIQVNKVDGVCYGLNYYNGIITVTGNFQVLENNSFHLGYGSMAVEGVTDIYNGAAFEQNTLSNFSTDSLILEGDLNNEQGTTTVFNNFQQYTSSTIMIDGGELIIEKPYNGSFESITGGLSVINDGSFIVSNNGMQFGAEADIGEFNGMIELGWGLRIPFESIITASDGTFKFTGSNTAQINCTSGNQLGNIIIDKDGTSGQCLLANPLITTGDITLIGGRLATGGNQLTAGGAIYIGIDCVLDADEGTIEVGGDWSNQQGDSGFIENGSIVRFNGDLPAVINDNEIFHDLEINKQTSNFYYLEAVEGTFIQTTGNLSINDGTLLLHTDCSLDVDGSLTVMEGAGLNCYPLDENISVVLGGQFLDHNSEVGFMTGFNPGQSEFTFDGDSPQTVQADREIMEFNNVIINSNGSYVGVHSNLRINGDLIVNSGYWNNGETGLTHYLCGSVTLCENGWWDNQGTVIFYGSTEAFYEVLGGGVNFHNVIIDKNPEDGRNETRSPDITLGSNLYLLQDGDLTVESGSLISGGAEISCSGDVSVNGGILYLEPDTRLRIGNECALNVNDGGTLICNGSEQYPVDITCYNAGHYHEVNINTGGTIYAEYTTFQYLADNGVYVTMEGSVDEDHAFNHCTFQNGVNAGKMLRLRNDQNLVCNEAVFPENTWGGSYNVYKSRNTGSIELINASGEFSGESHDYDPYNLIDWTIITPPEITVYADEPMDFGEVIIGEMSSIGFDIQNTGTMELTGTITTPECYTVSLWSRDGEERIIDRNTLNFTVEGGGLHCYRVDFEPQEEINYTGQIVIEHNADSVPALINVTGDGIPNPPPACETQTEPFNFGDVFVGEADSTWINIYNSGGSALIGTITTPEGYTIEEVVWRNPASELTRQEETVLRNSLDFEIQAGWMMDFELTFTPAQMQEYNGTLLIEHNAPESQTEILVYGRGVESILEYTPYVMSTVLTPNTSENFTLSLSNEGNTDINYIAYVEFEGVDNTIFEEDFEDSFPPDGWSITTSGWDNWYQNDWQAYNGNYCAAAMGMDDELRMTTHWFTPADNSILIYWLKSYYDYWDDWMTGSFSIEITTDGSNWTSLSEMSQEYLPEEWSPYGVILSDYAGQNIRLSFHLTDNSMGRGAMLDDVKVTGEINPAYNWLQIDGQSALAGSINGFSEENFNVTFSSESLSEQDYFGSIKILNSSRNCPQITIQTALNVGIYNMSITPAGMDFGEVTAGESVTREFTINNTGSLELSGEISVPEGFSIAEPPPGERNNTIEYMIFPGNSFTYLVTFDPSTYGDFSGDAVIDNIWTDDIELISLTAVGLAPGFNSNEDVLIHEQQPGGSGSDILTFYNEGNQQLEYTAGITYMPNSRDILVSSGFDNEFPPTGWQTEDLAMAGNWWQDMMSPHTGMCAAAADPYMMVDARLITPQFTATPDCQLTYYIRTYNQPSAGGSFGVEVSLDGVTWTFIEQIDMTTLSMEYQQRTLSLAEYSGSNIYIAFRMYDNVNYYCAGLLLDDVEINGNPVAFDEWLSLNGENSQEGTIDPGENCNIEVGYNAADLPEGNYSAEINVNSNDPLYLQTSIMVELNVGYPHISVNPDTLDFWDTLTGQETWQSFTIENMGVLTLSGEMIIPDGFYVLEDTLNWVREEFYGRSRISTFDFSIEPWMYQHYYIIFAPEIACNYDGELIITHNAPEAEVSIGLGAVGVSVPVVATAVIIDITDYTATGGGNVTNDGGSEVYSRGICWNESGMPSIDMDMFTEDGSGSGEFSSEINALMPGRTYYVRAYAENYYGIGYGNEVSFMTSGPLITVSAESLPDFGDVGLSGYSEIQSYTVSATSLESDLMIYAPNGFELAVNDLRNPIFLEMINLEPVDGTIAETTVLVRFNPQNIGEYNAEIRHYSMSAEQKCVQVQGTGVEPAELNISVAALTDFGELEAGEISAEADYTVSGINLVSDVLITAPEGFEISTAPSERFSRRSREFTSQIVLSPIAGVLDITNIYVRFHPLEQGIYADHILHETGFAQTGEVSVSGTCISLPEVITLYVNEISYHTVSAGGEIISDGNLALETQGFCYSMLPEPDLTDNFITADADNGFFTADIADINDGTTYFLRSFATNSSGTAYGNEIRFTTLAEPEIDLPEEISFNEDELLVMDFSDYINDNDSDELILTASDTDYINVEIDQLTVAFSAPENYYGSESVTFTVSDDISRASVSEEILVNVLPVNDPPVIELPDNFTFDEDGSLEVDFASYIYDVDNIDIMLSSSGEQNIQLEISGLYVNFSAAENWFGSEDITFFADDQQGRIIVSDTATIIVNSVNDAPVSDAGDIYEGQADVTGYCQILLNGSGSYDIDGEIVNWDWMWEGGSASGESVTAEFPAGTTDITLTVTDNEGAFSADSTSIVISSYDNLPPVAQADTYFSLEDEIISDNVMNNDFDPDNYPSTLSAELTIDVMHGVLEFAETGEFIYQPEADWNGLATFSYRIYDGEDHSDPVEVELNIDPVNDPPVIALPEELTFTEHDSLTVDFSEYISDIDNDPLSISVSGNNNVMIDIEEFAVTFSAIDNWFGSESVIFIVNDEISRSTVQDTVEIIVLPALDYGDIDDNGLVESYDVSLILQYIVLLDPLPEDPLPWEEWRCQRANVDLNEYIDAYDAALILRYIVGLIDELPVRCNDYSNELRIVISSDDQYLYFTAMDEIFSLDYHISETENLKTQSPELLQNNCLFSCNADRSALASATALKGRLLRIPYQRTCSGTSSISFEVECNGSYFNMRYELPDHAAEATQLENIYPNPFNPSTTIDFNLGSPSAVVMDIYNVKGQKVVELLNAQLDSGKHSVIWNAENYGSGIYFLKVKIADQSYIRKLILLK